MRAAFAGVLLATAVQQASAQDGAAVFAARCASCHAVMAGAPTGPGPNLLGVVGRRLGGDPGFDYSPAFEEAREGGRSWDAALLDAYLADSEAVIPGNWMGENGLRDPAQRAAVVRYLATLR